MRSCKMTKMHFQLIAEMLGDLGQLHAWSRDTATNVAVRAAGHLRRTNPAFDGQRFVRATLKAAGYEG